MFVFLYAFKDVGLPALAAALACLAGCSIIPDYPATLPKLTASDTRVGVSPDIAGQYADKGEGFSPEGKALGQASLTQLLHARGQDDGALRNADYVVVTGPVNDTLELQSFQGDKLLATLRRHESPAAAEGSAYPNTYVGNKGFVWLGLESVHAGAPGIGGHVSDESLWLRKAVDGSLIVLHRDMGAGVVVIVPVWGRNDVWYRFRPIDAP